MRILIITQPRTGGTVFSKWLSKELGFTWINEPFNMVKDKEIIDFFSCNNIVVKLIYEIGRGEWFYDKRISNIEQLLSFNWDIVFILTRNDTYDQAISKVWADQNRKWHTNYEINDDWIKKHKRIIQDYLIQLDTDKNYLNSIGLNQITYEGIYKNGNDLLKIQSMFNFKEMTFLDDLSTKKRYRGGQILKNTKLI